MRGRKPHALTAVADDLLLLQRLARRRHLPWFQVERARLILAIAGGQSVEALAAQRGYSRATIWRICQDYEEGGLEALLSEDSRSGRPREISPPPAGPDRPTGLPGADRQGPAHHPLDQPRPGSPSRRRRHRAGHQ
jgi:hypothetical protein